MHRCLKCEERKRLAAEALARGESWIKIAQILVSNPSLPPLPLPPSPTSTEEKAQ